MSNKMELMQLFEAQKNKALLIQSEIDKTDNEINNMVYDLYGLKKEDIEIIESEI